MMISARNQIEGTVTKITEGAVNGIVNLKFGDHVVSSTISMASIKELGLAENKEAVAVIKATEVMVGVGEIGKISARNIWKGTVSKINEGAVNGIVIINVSGVEISATISMASIQELGLEVGKEVSAIVKSTSVMMMV